MKISNIKYEIMLAVFVILYIVYFSVVTIQRHRSLNSGYYDLAIMDQTVYNTYRGRILELTDPQGTNNFKRMAIHNDILLAVLAPFYFLYRGPETLLVIQTIILALGAIPLYLLARKLLKSRQMALVFAFVYLIYPALQNANIFDFHAVTLATSFLLFMVYFALEKKYFFSLIFFLLAIFSKEQVALTTAMFGLYLLLGKKQVRFGLVVLLMSILWFVLSIWVIIPYFRQAPHFALFRYKELGDSPSAIITGLLVKPQLFFKQAFSSDTFKYLFQLLVPLAFLPLLAPSYLLVILPELAINILSSHWQMRTIDLHYTAVITPFILIGAVFGAEKILGQFKLLSLKRLVLTMLIASLLMNYFKGASFFSREAKVKDYFRVRPEVSSVKLWEKTLANEKIPVAASEGLGPHFSQRITLYRFSEIYKKADYVVLLVDNIYNDWLNKKESIKAYKMLQQDPNFKLIFKKDEFEVYEKIKSL